MSFVIKAKDGSYKKDPGEGRSARYDDQGFTVSALYHADQYLTEQAARYDLHLKGKWSEKEGARIVPIVIREELTLLEKVMDTSESLNTILKFDPSLNVEIEKLMKSCEIFLDSQKDQLCEASISEQVD